MVKNKEASIAQQYSPASCFCVSLQYCHKITYPARSDLRISYFAPSFLRFCFQQFLKQFPLHSVSFVRDADYIAQFLRGKLQLPSHSGKVPKADALKCVMLVCGKSRWMDFKKRSGLIVSHTGGSLCPSNRPKQGLFPLLLGFHFPF